MISNSTHFSWNGGNGNCPSAAEYMEIERQLAEQRENERIQREEIRAKQGRDARRDAR